MILLVAYLFLDNARVSTAGHITHIKSYILPRGRISHIRSYNLLRGHMQKRKMKGEKMKKRERKEMEIEETC